MPEFITEMSIHVHVETNKQTIKHTYTSWGALFLAHQDEIRGELSQASVDAGMGDADSRAFAWVEGKDFEHEGTNYWDHM